MSVLCADPAIGAEIHFQSAILGCCGGANESRITGFETQWGGSRFSFYLSLFQEEATLVESGNAGTRLSISEFKERRPDMTDLIQLIYSSRPFGFDDAALNGILMFSRRNNPREAITGALICRHDLYLQLLEGPQATVEARYQKIARDDRHLEVVKRVSRPITERMFPNWAMRDDPARSWMWTANEVKLGVLDRADAAEFIAVFDRLAAEVD
jgi:hypothetical protein